MEDRVENVNEDERQWVEQVCHQARPQREVGPEAREEAHDDADKQNDEQLRGEFHVMSRA